MPGGIGLNGFEKRSQRIKDKIMRTTLELLKTTDSKVIRIADIAEAAKVSQVTIYNYFGSKEALLSKVLKAHIDKEMAEFEAYMNQAQTLKERITYMIFHKKEAYRIFTLDLVRELIVNDGEITTYIQEEYRNKIFSLMTRIIEEGKRSGEISGKASIPVILAYLEILMKQPMEMLDAARQKGDMERFIEEFMDLFFYGICGRQ